MPMAIPLLQNVGEGEVDDVEVGGEAPFQNVGKSGAVDCHS